MQQILTGVIVLLLFCTLIFVIVWAAMFVFYNFTTIAAILVSVSLISILTIALLKAAGLITRSLPLAPQFIKEAAMNMKHDATRKLSKTETRFWLAYLIVISLFVAYFGAIAIMGKTI